MPKPSLNQLISQRDDLISLLIQYPNSLWFPGEIQILNEEIWRRKDERKNG